MKLEISKQDARTVLLSQLKEYLADIQKVVGCFEDGEAVLAYNAFPYLSPVGANLEEYVNSLN